MDMKKPVSLLLAAVMALGMATTAFAQNPKITKQVAAIEGTDVGERGPGHKIWLPLVASAFDEATEDLTMSDVKTSKITVKQSVRSGSKAIDSVEIKEDSNKKANILITLAETFASTKPLDFETTVTLYINNKKQGFSTVVSGTLSNEETLVYSDTDYIDLSNGQTAKCEETSSKVEAYLGSNISVFIRMLKGKQYYGNVSMEPDADDIEVMDAYSDIEEVYTITGINLDASGKTVKIDSDTNYYVYGSDLEFLGRTKDMLTYSAKYYLATKQLDIAETDEPSDEEIIEEDTDENTGESAEESGEQPEQSEGDETLKAVAPNPNGSNPDTGAGPGLAIAVVTGTLALAVMLSVGRRGKRRS